MSTLPGTEPCLRCGECWTEAVHPPPPISAANLCQAPAVGAAERAWRWLWSLRARRRGCGSILEPRGEARAPVPHSPACHRRWQTAKAVGAAKAVRGGENYLGEAGRSLGRFPDPWMGNAARYRPVSRLPELGSLASAVIKLDFHTGLTRDSVFLRVMADFI